MIVKTHTEDGHPHFWWKNILRTVSPAVLRAGSYQEAVETLLAEHNGKVNYGSLEFDTEQDYVMVVLKWS